MKTLLLVLLSTYCVGFHAQTINLEKDGVVLNATLVDGSFQLTLTQNGINKLEASLGASLNLTSSDVVNCPNATDCFIIRDESIFQITTRVSNGFQILWSTQDVTKIFSDCYKLGQDNWFGGPERYTQLWPIEKLILDNFPNIPQEDRHSAVCEPYWLNSRGAYIYVNEKVPLFIDQNNTRAGEVCFIAKIEKPYFNRTKILLNYTIAALNDPREGHIHAVENFLGKPTGHPDEKMIRNPVWSTWARYRRNATDESVLELAQEILDHGYNDGQLEIDDFWEECYGALTFNNKFTDITNTVAQLHNLGFRVTLWTHPFINVDCEEYTQIALENGYVVNSTDGNTITHWWNSIIGDARHLDFTKPSVRQWYTDRLNLLKTNHGIDGFKFDAGEITFAPWPPVLVGEEDSIPSILTNDYVRMCADYGLLSEVRSAWRTQDLPIFLRMLDKDSWWGSNDGLATIITTLLQFNMNGYPMVLPDMVGGNGYLVKPNAELFVRWLQATVFMPAIQFSIVPWDFEDETAFDVVAISKKMVELHQQYSDLILEAMDRSITLGHPVNAPIWWVSPEDTEAHKVDDQFLLGETILVAPVIVEGAITRDVYIPAGNWLDGNLNITIQGPTTLPNYRAPIEVLPYFIKLN